MLHLGLAAAVIALTGCIFLMTLLTAAPNGAPKPPDSEILFGVAVVFDLLAGLLLAVITIAEQAIEESSEDEPTA